MSGNVRIKICGVGTPEDALAAADAGADLIGVNNRDLATFTTDLSITEHLAQALAERSDPEAMGGVVLVAESGIRDRSDIERLRGAGARAFLVGESLMREPDLGSALRQLRTGAGK